MAKSSRPSLGAVMGKVADRDPATTSPATDAAETVQRRVGKRRQGFAQLNVFVPKDLRTRAKIKALQADQDLSDVVTELLEAWVKTE